MKRITNSSELLKNGVVEKFNTLFRMEYFTAAKKPTNASVTLTKKTINALCVTKTGCTSERDIDIYAFKWAFKLERSPCLVSADEQICERGRERDY